MRTILVIGATGQQGGSVVRHLLANGEFAVRCLVRDDTSEKALKLVEQGATVVKGDLNDVDSLVQAASDCYGVFGVTNFWDKDCGYEKEIQHGKNIGTACKTANVKHLVFSTLDRNSDVPHFESKVIAEDYIKSLGVPLTSLVTSFYFENLTTFFPPKVGDDGTVHFSVAQKETTKVPMYSCYDTGAWVLEAFKNPDKYIGSDISAVSQYITYPELVKTFSDVTGKKADYTAIPLDVFRGFGFPGVDELADNLKFFDDVSEKVKDERRNSNDNVICGEQWKDFLLRTKWMS